jgi:AMMECR1 domain-containing protein
LDSRLSVGQIVALRFASNDEFVELARRAVEENLSQKQIKNAIQHWKGDYYRV